MSILSELSRRFSMLTTDAKPDPPRIEINGYTHNLNSNRENEEIKTKSRFAHVASKVQFEENNVTSSENKKSVLNGSIPINTNSSFTKQNFDDANNSATNENQQKGPNIKTKKKSKQYKYSQGTHVVNYNIINSNGVKIGPKTSYICNINQFPTNNAEASDETGLKAEIRQMPIEVKHFCSSTKEITLEDIFTIKTYIGRNWKDVARKLLYTDGQIDQFEENYRFKGIGEIVYQIFLDWKQANTKDAEIGKLVKILWACREYDCAVQLVSAHKNFE